MKKALYWVLAATLVLALAANVGRLIIRRLDVSRETEDYERAAEIAKAPDFLFVPAKGLPGQTSGELADDGADHILTELSEIDLEALRAINEEVVGWICIPGTELSYPLFKCEDNQYYLTHNWQKKKSTAGAVFLDYRTALNDPYALIYGHRLKNASMFGTLKFYQEADYWREHPSVYLVSPDAAGRYDIFAAFEASVTSDVYKLDQSEEEREQFLAWCLEQSDIDTGVVPAAGEPVICLSTCTNRGSSSGTRWVVLAALASSQKPGSASKAADYTAANFIPGISGRLSSEIIPLGMNDDGAAENITNLKSLIVKTAPGISLICQKRKQISGMARVRRAGRIKMTAGA